MKGDVKVGDNVGTVGRGAEDQGDIGDWKRTTADFTLTVDPERFSAAILRGAFAFNDAIVATIMKEQQK